MIRLAYIYTTDNLTLLTLLSHTNTGELTFVQNQLTLEITPLTDKTRIESNKSECNFIFFKSKALQEDDKKIDERGGNGLIVSLNI